jgi:putative transposase
LNHLKLQQVVNAILYLVFTGCQWRFLPKDYPHWRTVYGYFARWQTDGTLVSDTRNFAL